jgi:predicted RNase H-like HicB family nuclease
MHVVKVVVWQEKNAWLGYLQEYPDYWTQGESLEDLREHLKDLHQTLTESGLPPV